MTHNADDLALYAITSGTFYGLHLQLARADNPVTWAKYTVLTAMQYRQEIADPPKFSTVDILQCAAHLAEYYTQHLAESEAVQSLE